MRVLVYEFASGGGLAGDRVPRSLAREGAAMRAALVDDLIAIGGLHIVTTADAHVAPRLPRGVEVTVLPSGDRARAAALDRLIASVDGVWLIAPETGGCLERLAESVERQGKVLFGSTADAIARAADKARLPARLAAAGVRHPLTRPIGPVADRRDRGAAIAYPAVVKPARGAGSDGVILVRTARGLERAVADARQAARGGAVVAQEFIPGTPASVSLLADGRDAIALALNAQAIASPRSFAYRGGTTPLEHPLSSAALAAALAACRALPGLRGFVGVDLILTGTDVFVIEVNARLTTAFLGLRAAIDDNVAALALTACAGRLPPRPALRRGVRFSSAGRVVFEKLRCPRPSFVASRGFTTRASS
ncbi:MAG TPA: ATP-grasp domain-containing protein [Vicinamibacterales bacterium]|nr:ATP-grasp domain-containing protein [Vicinamibacterales bacterium]